MADVALTDLLSRIRPECRGCPTDQMAQVLLDTIRDFCTVTRAWQQEFTDTIVIGTSEYAVEVPSVKAVPMSIEYMTVDGERSWFKTVAYLDSHIPDWRHRSCDDFSMFTQLRPGYFVFPCVPLTTGTTDGVFYRLSLTPAADASEVPDDFADEWIEIVSTGAKAALKAMPDKPWSDAKRAADLAKDYRHDRTWAQIRVNRSYGNSSDRIVGPRFA